jgi:hypothetical protein
VSVTHFVTYRTGKEFKKKKEVNIAKVLRLVIGFLISFSVGVELVLLTPWP